jgi:hypothetical protein
MDGQTPIGVQTLDGPLTPGKVGSNFFPTIESLLRAEIYWSIAVCGGLRHGPGPFSESWHEMTRSGPKEHLRRVNGCLMMHLSQSASMLEPRPSETQECPSLALAHR